MNVRKQREYGTARKTSGWIQSFFRLFRYFRVVRILAASCLDAIELQAGITNRN
jgi:hypothetical protein